MIIETINPNQTIEMPAGAAGNLRLQCLSLSSRFENHDEENVNSSLGASFNDGKIGHGYLTEDLNLRQA